MSKKKNTLKDLDEFLRQQAASIVEPTKLGSENKGEEKLETVSQTKNDLDFESIVHQLKYLSEKKGQEFRGSLYDFIIQSVESLDQSLPEDKMLINTALYLKSGEEWKEVIRQYWRKK